MKTKCSVCQSSVFETSLENVNEFEPVVFIRCSNCKTAVGVLQYGNVSKHSDAIIEQLNKLERHISILANNLTSLINNTK